MIIATHNLCIALHGTDRHKTDSPESFLYVDQHVRADRPYQCLRTGMMAVKGENVDVRLRKSREPRHAMSDALPSSHTESLYEYVRGESFNLTPRTPPSSNMPASRRRSSSKVTPPRAKTLPMASSRAKLDPDLIAVVRALQQRFRDETHLSEGNPEPVMFAEHILIRRFM